MTARIEWIPSLRVWKVWVGSECVGWRRRLADAEALGIAEAERREDGAA